MAGGAGRNRQTGRQRHMRLLHAKRLRDGTEARHEVAHERREEHRHADRGGEPDGSADDGLASHAGSLAAMARVLILTAHAVVP